MRHLLLLLSMTIAATQLAAQTFKYFAGTLHAHSAFSDGNKDRSTTGVSTPEGSFKFASESENFHFLGISEHNHKKAGMKVPANFKLGQQQAAKVNKNDKFVCLYGMEYGVISGGGHVLVYGVDDLIGWEPDNFDVECARNDYTSLWDIIVDYPGAFATLAHPESNDFQNLLKQPYNKTADKVISGVAIMTGPAFAENTDYISKPAKKFTDYFRAMLAKGYHVGPTVDHDNHNLTFGRMASSRTVVLSQKLHRDSIMKALQEMRFYASADWNTKVSFTINGFPMGKRINTRVPASIRVTVKDEDIDDKTASIKLMYGIPGSNKLSTELTKTTKSDELSFSNNQPKGSVYYYYLEITQTDGNKIFTSPIWVHRLK